MIPLLKALALAFLVFPTVGTGKSFYAAHHCNANHPNEYEAVCDDSESGAWCCNEGDVPTVFCPADEAAVPLCCPYSAHPGECVGTAKGDEIEESIHDARSAMNQRRWVVSYSSYLFTSTDLGKKDAAASDPLSRIGGKCQDRVEDIEKTLGLSIASVSGTGDGGAKITLEKNASVENDQWVAFYTRAVWDKQHASAEEDKANAFLNGISLGNGADLSFHFSSGVVNRITQECSED